MPRNKASDSTTNVAPGSARPERKRLGAKLGFMNSLALVVIVVGLIAVLVTHL